MKSIIAIIGGIMLVMSCGSSETSDSGNSEEKKNSSSNSAEPKEVEVADTTSDNMVVEEEEQVSLPTGQLESVEDMDFEIMDTIVIQEFESGNVAGVETVEIFMTEDHDIVMGVSNEDGLFIDWFLIDIDDVGPWTFDAKVTLEDICGDNEEELVLWWETRDGHSGFYEGYEMELSGLMVLNAYSMKAYLDLAYYDRYMTYEAPYEEEADEEEAVHGKMNENTQFDECSYSMEVKLDKNKVVVSDYEKTIDTSEDCKVLEVMEGVYTFDSAKEAFVGPK